MECSLFKVALRNLHISLSVIKRAFQDVVSLLISLSSIGMAIWRDFILPYQTLLLNLCVRV